MKFLTALVGILLVAVQAGAADSPVHWSLAGAPGKPITSGAAFTLKLSARIDPAWHLYGLEQEEGGPVPTEISLGGESFLEMGAIRASKPIQLLDPNFNRRVALYVDKAEFSVPLKVVAGTIEGDKNAVIRVRYQCCNGSMCLPPRTAVLEFLVVVKGRR